MSGNSSAKKHFRVIEGGLSSSLKYRGINIFAGPEGAPPPAVDARVVEEDRYLVMSADREVRPPAESMLKVMTRLIETRPREIGDIVVKKARPLIFMAVIYDVDQEPIWREEWIAGALRNIWHEAENRELSAIAMPVLGARYGRIDHGRFAGLLAETLAERQFRCLKRLWLIVAGEEKRMLMDYLRTRLTQES